MNVQDFVQAIVSFVREHESWAIPVVFLVSFGESFCFFSLFWPGTAILAGIAVLMAASGADVAILTPAILAAGAGGGLGYALSYWLGVYFKDRVSAIWPFSSRPNLIPQGQRFFERYGAFGVFLGHFFGPVRAVIPVVAGMFAMRQIPFQIANFASAFLWAAGVILPAFFLVTFKDDVLFFVREHQGLVALVMFALALLASIPHLLAFFPPAILFVVLGLLYIYAGGDFAPVWLASAFGAFIGDLVAYRAGQSQDNLTDIWFMKEDADTIENTRKFIEGSGMRSVIASKFLWIRRAWAPVVAGSIGYPPWLQFVVASAISSLLWAAVFLSLRYLLIPFGV